MSDWSLDEIKNQVKEYIGDSGFDTDDLTERINRIYRDSMPLEFDVEDLHSVMCQTMVANTESYAVNPDVYLWVRGPVYLDDLTHEVKYPIKFTRDKGLYRASYPEVATAGTASDYAGIPAMVLYEKHTLFFGPIPDDAYKAYFESYIKPTALSAGADKPIQQIWGPVIACDTAIAILIGREDADDIPPIQAARKYFASIITDRELEDLTGVRAQGSF